MPSVTQTLLTVCDELKNCLAQVDPSGVERALTELSTAKRIFLAGAGRSGLGVRGFAMRLMHMGQSVHFVGDCTTPGIGAGDLLVIGSGSGRTASLLAMAQKAKHVGARVFLVTIDSTSPIAQLADCVVPIPAPSPKAQVDAGLQKSVQPMGSLFEQSLFILFDSLILLLMQKQGIDADEMFARHANLE